MGSDMLLALMREPTYSPECVKLKNHTERYDRPESAAEHRKQVRMRHIAAARIDNILKRSTDESIARLGEALMGWWDEDLDRPVNEQRGMIRQQLMLDVEEVLIRDNREVAQVYLEELDGSSSVYLASGGLSSGDAPTDAYLMIERLDGFGLFDFEITVEEYRQACEEEKKSRV